jgi:hypothetical protein
MHVPWDIAGLALSLAVGAGICPALDSSLPWLELGSAETPRRAGGACERGCAECSGADERHDEAVGRAIGSGDAQLMADFRLCDALGEDQVSSLRIMKTSCPWIA